MNSVAAVLATASLASSFNIRVILPDGGKHHTESLKLSNAVKPGPSQKEPPGSQTDGMSAGRIKAARSWHEERSGKGA